MKKIWLYIAILITYGCSQGKHHPAEDRIVASVGNRLLYQSDLSGIIPEGTSIEDSISIINQSVDNWIRKSIVLDEAEKNLKSQIDIDKLVSDYKESLLIYNYEKKLVEDQLDTIITTEQKEEFYLSNKHTYKLVNPVVRGIIIVVPSDIKGISQFKRSWVRQDLKNLKNFVENNNLTARIDEINWITFVRFKEIMPQELFSDSQLRSKKSLDKESDGLHYFVKVLDFLDTNETAPLNYIEDKVEKVILYNRKVNLLRKIKEQLYQSELKMNKIKIYTE